MERQELQGPRAILVARSVVGIVSGIYLQSYYAGGIVLNTYHGSFWSAEIVSDIAARHALGSPLLQAKAFLIVEDFFVIFCEYIERTGN